MIALRCRCAFAGLFLSLSWLLALAHDAAAQSAKSAAGQNCGCAKTNKSVVQPGVKSHQQSMASVHNHTAKHHAPHHQQMAQTTGLYPGQTTPWMMSQPVANGNYAMPGQMAPMMGQPAYLIAQPVQPGFNQPQANGNYAAPGQMAPMMGQPAYLITQPMQPGFNQNYPAGGQLTPLTAQPVYLMQPVQSGLPGSGAPNQNLANGVRYQPSQTSTPWALTPAANGSFAGSQQTCNCSKHTATMPSQSVSLNNQAGRQPATTAAAHHACPPQQMQHQAAHPKKK